MVSRPPPSPPEDRTRAASGLKHSGASFCNMLRKNESDRNRTQSGAERADARAVPAPLEYCDLTGNENHVHTRTMRRDKEKRARTHWLANLTDLVFLSSVPRWSPLLRRIFAESKARRASFWQQTSRGEYIELSGRENPSKAA